MPATGEWKLDRDQRLESTLLAGTDVWIGWSGRDSQMVLRHTGMFAKAGYSVSIVFESEQSLVRGR